MKDLPNCSVPAVSRLDVESVPNASTCGFFPAYAEGRRVNQGPTHISRTTWRPWHERVSHGGSSGVLADRIGFRPIGQITLTST